jgi:lipopolysaccharide/colanic/teichoic acid biosynthesis glycosyltransferase
MYLKFWKPVIDFLLCFFALILLFPLLLIVGIIVKVDSSGSIFFKQIRLGKGEKQFEVIKFRTMYTNNNRKEAQVFKDNNEITRVGYYLRRFKIDELPQLINVLRGEMAVIGPRPMLPQTKVKLKLDNTVRFDVKPGLSSAAGVNGSIFLNWTEKIEYDLEYVKNISFLIDVRIILKSILVMFIGEKRFLKPLNPKK